MARRRMSPEVAQAISNASRQFGIPINVMTGYADVESRFNPRSQRPNSVYSGLFQLSPEEFRRGGGTGSIFDPHQNAMAAGRLLAGQRQDLAKQLGREPSWNEVYLSHQQGPGGIAAHVRNPTGLAWQNMASTAEGRKKDARGPVYTMPDGSKGLWSQAAVAGNIPGSPQGQPRLDWRTATSADFMQAWDARLERAGIPRAVTQVADSTAPQLDMNPQVGPRDLSMLSASDLTSLAPRNDSPYETVMGPVASVGDVAASTPTPIVAGVQPSSGIEIGNIFGQKNIPGASSIGAALSAAGKAIIGGGVKVPEGRDSATQMAALDSPEKWPTIPILPRRRPPGVGPA